MQCMRRALVRWIQEKIVDRAEVNNLLSSLALLLRSSEAVAQGEKAVR